MVLYSSPSEKKLIKVRLFSSKSIVWCDKASAEYFRRRPSMPLRPMFNSETMSVGSGLDLSKDLEMRE